jgi:glutamyl-tRNA reductase
MDFKAIGISHHSIPLRIREWATLNESEVRDFLLRLRDTLSLEESLVISTCNRTEIYYSSSKDLALEIISLLESYKCLEAGLLKQHFEAIDEEATVLHLFEVSLGLDSQVLGDIQISNQIKKAYQASADQEMAGPFLHRLMHTIFYANKRVVQETGLQEGNASIASVAADYIKRFAENVSEPRIAVVGLGEIGQNVLENLGEVKANICLLNRTKAKAVKLATSDNISVKNYSDKEAVFKECDIIVSAVSGEKELMSLANFEGEDFLHKLIIDLSVPRSIPEEIGKIAGLTYYNVDQMLEKTEKVKKRRAKFIPDARQIIKESIGSFNDWKEEMEVSPTIQKLKETLDKIRKQELARHSGKVSVDEMELLELVTKNMIQKVIKLPVLQLKAACKRGESENLIGVLNDLFNLEAEDIKKVN